MKAIMITYDSLNRHFLSPYGCNWVQTPNFERLAKKCVTFDKSYVGSLPTIPARREFHTGRHNFLHRRWGPLEPFDDSMPEILRDNGIHSHLTSDTLHYWLDGGCSYHNRYSSFEFFRGQESDAWKTVLGDVEIPEHLGQACKQDIVNRAKNEADMPQTKTFQGGLDFLDTNHNENNWFLHVETFDPHEPFFSMPEYMALYEKDYNGPLFDWPVYRPVSEEEKPYVEHVRKMYAALVTMCDRNLGKILDKMDTYGLWEDTLLIVNTDHGVLLGEHGYWAKYYEGHPFEEITHTPLFIYDPRSKASGRCDCLVQTIDLAPTILEYFEKEIPKDMMGRSLKNTIANGTPVRETAIFGIFGGQICCTNGKAVYMLASPMDNNKLLFNYTLMPTNMIGRFSLEELHGATLSKPFSFTKGCRLLRTPSYNPDLESPHIGRHKTTQLYDLEKDPHQMNPIKNAEFEEYFRKEIVRHLQENDAPDELYIHMGLRQGYTSWIKRLRGLFKKS